MPEAPNTEQILHTSEGAQQEIINYVDKLVSTINPGVQPDGSDVANAPQAKGDPHICSIPYSQIEDFQQDLIDLVATCQRHTRCSTAYCLRNKNGKQECRFGYPKPLQANTTILSESEDPEIVTARNDGLVNRYNPL